MGRIAIHHGNQPVRSRPWLYDAVVTMRFHDAEQGIIITCLKKGKEEQVMAYRTADVGQTWDSE